MLEKFSLYLKLDRGLSEKTVEAYRQDLLPFLESNVEFTRLGIQKYLESLQREGISNRSLARKISALRAFFKFAVAGKFCASDPMEEIEAPKTAKSLPKTLAFEHVEALLECPLRLGAISDGIMLRVLYASGLRVSELISLSASNLDVQAGMLRVHGKGGKTRIVPLDGDTCALLSKYMSTIRPALLEKGGTQGQNAVFLSQRGQPFTRQGFWKLVKKYALLSGIPGDVSPHVLRHAFATHLLERGMNLRSLQMLLGHSDISTTEIYSHVSKSHLHEALRKHHPRSKS